MNSQRIDASVLTALREHLGVVLKDSGRYNRALRDRAGAANGDPLWLHLCNRNEVLDVNPQGPGVRCPWRWTSDLHACKVRPDFGRRLAQKAFTDWPVEFSERPVGGTAPLVSFIIAHEGHERLDHVVRTVQSILAQREVSVECLVVEQSAVPSLRDRLPQAVQHLHRPRPEGVSGWRKSWALNQGARVARGDLLVFHDGDIVCPSGYAAALLAHMPSYGAASIQRFLFNLNQTDTEDFLRTGRWPTSIRPERVRQNWEGGTIAVRRDAFFQLGGYDEGFVGWGGEDNEFFNRCSAVQHLTWGFVPFLHLWHPSQSDKHTTENRNITHFLDARLRIPVTERTVELCRRDFGHPQRPDPLTGYRDSPLTPDECQLPANR